MLIFLFLRREEEKRKRRVGWTVLPGSAIGRQSATEDPEQARVELFCPLVKN
jgi:hypothetical protein